MAKFNEKAKDPTVTSNYEGAHAYELTDHMHLYTRVLTSMFGENKFYESAVEADNIIVELTRKLAKTDPRFVAGLGILVRNKFYLRSIPQVLAVELANVHKGDNLVSKMINAYMIRPDEMTELLAYFGMRFGNTKSTKFLRKIPNQIKKGLADVFRKFDEYQLKKYDRDGTVKLRDVMFLTHPKPKDAEQAAIWKRLVDGDMKVAGTWEETLSAAGQKGADKKESWEEIIPKMGIMAILKNLKNFEQANVDSDLYVPKLTNPKIIEKSKLLPFRFMSAHRELERAGASTKVLNAVIDAMDLSVVNIHGLPGKTLIAADNSGSMTSLISEHSTVTARDIANLFAAIVHKKYPDSVVGVFATNWNVVPMSSRDSILNNKQKLDRTTVGYSTDTWKVFEWLSRQREKFDRVIMLSDMQAWDSGRWGYGVGNTVEAYYKKYCNTHKHQIPVYSINLMGYGTSDIDPKNPRIHKLAGWSDKTLEYIAASEEDPKSIMRQVYTAIDNA